MNLINQNVEFVHLDYRKLKLFQGDLKQVDKSEYKKLENSLKKKGNFDVIRVWLKEKNYFILDGHTRVQFFKDKKVKFGESYEVPCVVIHADNEQDAKEKLLLLNAQYGEMTKDGLARFVGTEIPADWFETYVRFNHIDNFEWLKQVQGQQAMLTQDLISTPVIMPINTLIGKNDIITPISESDKVEEQVPELVGKTPAATDDGYSNFSIVMIHENKQKLDATLDAIKTEKGYEKREDALMYLVNLYN